MGVLPLSSGLWTQDAGNLLPYEMMVGEARGRPAPGGRAKREGPAGKWDQRVLEEAARPEDSARAK